MKKILCPVNFTDTALNAIEYASSLANLHLGSLTLYHVVTNEEYNEMLEGGTGDLPEHLKRGTQELEKRLHTLCQEISSAYPDLHCHYRIGYGSLTNAVIDLAKQEGYDLIVMGNGGVTNVTEALDGSSTVKVIERASCPVLCVPYQADFQGMQRVVFGTEFREVDRNALHQLMLMLQPIGSRIEVVHVLKGKDKEAKEKVRRQLDELKSYLHFKKITYTLKEGQESIRLGLNDFMEEVKGDVLVLTTHQRGFFERVFQKSNFKNLSYFADYPMLIFLEENLLKK